ncbi:MAG: ABC transporter ATP-binding protein, partial [Chloroflexi bacterium]
GVGKSTFLKTIIGQLPPLAGEARLGAQVKIGYFAQAHEDLHAANTVLDELLTVRNLPIDEARNYLGRFLFSNDDVFRKVETLSGGERGRLALAKLALDGSNVLLLDEPTNHLDIDSQEILQSVLEGYDGTIILVTHDRYLVNALATQIWAAMPGQLQFFGGSYAEYLEARERERQAKLSQQREQDAGRKAAQYAEKKHGLNPYQLQQRLEALENEIEALEAQMDELTTAIDEAGAAGDTEQVRELGERYTETEAALQAAMEEWERLAE